MALMVKAALRMYEDSLCACGHSMMLTQAEDARVAYQVTTVTCPACELREKERENERGAGRITMVRDLRDTPGAMDDGEVRWVPGPGDVVQLRSPEDIVADGEGVAEELDVESHVDVVAGKHGNGIADTGERVVDGLLGGDSEVGSGR